MNDDVFRLLATSVVDYAIYSLDRQGRVVSWNPGAERIKGYREDEILGAHFSRFYPPELARAGKPDEELRAAAMNGRFADEGWRVRKDGSRFWASVLIAPMRDDGGEIIGFAKITRDLTDRKRAEEGLLAEVDRRRQAEADLHELNRSLEVMVEARTAELSRQNTELREAQGRLLEFPKRLINAQEDERRRIAQDLHDETGQAMSVMKLHLAEALRDPEQRTRRIEACLLTLDQAIQHVRKVAHSLRPAVLDDLGLADAIEWIAEQQAAANNWRVSRSVDPIPRTITPLTEIACFRIVQEALTNAARHAGAHNVDVRVEVLDNAVSLTISDDGRGFQAGGASSTGREGDAPFGLVSMAQRAAVCGGDLRVRSVPGSGTVIHATLPLGAMPSASLR